MMNAIRILAPAGLALAACLLPAAATSAPSPRDYEAVGDKPAVSLDPAASYLIVQTNSDSSMFSFPVTLIRIPDQADLDDYRARRAAALAKAHSKWEGRHRAWEKSAEQWLAASPEARRGMARPVAPVEPNDANLAFPPIDVENLVTIGPFDRFAKRNGRSTFLHRVKPGRYAFYGPVNIGQGGAAGTCMCMGTIEFEVKPGEIVHAGMMQVNFMEERARAKAEGRKMPHDDLDLPESLNSISWEVPEAGASIDPRLSSYRIRPAELRAARRFPNYFGVQIDRLTSLPGILAYERDRVIDVKSGRPAD